MSKNFVSISIRWANLSIEKPRPDGQMFSFHQTPTSYNMTTPADADYDNILAEQRLAEMEAKSKLVNLVAVLATGKFVSPQILAAKQKDIDQIVARTQDIIQAR